MAKSQNITSKFKLWLLISVLVLLVGSIILSIFGFNKGLDFKGGNSVTVNTGSYISLDKSNRVEISKINRAFFKANGFKVQTEQFSPTEDLVVYNFAHIINGKKVTAVEFKAQMDIIGEKLVAELESKIESDTAAFSVENYNFGSSVNYSIYWQTPLAILAFLAVAFIYLGIRTKFPSAIAAVITVFFDILLTFALIVIFRILVNITVVYAIMAAVVYSTLLSTFTFTRIRSLKKIEGSDQPNKIADSAVCYYFKNNIISCAAILATLIALVVFGTVGVARFALPLIAAIIATTYSSIVIAPSIWVYFEKVSIKIKGGSRYQAKKAAKLAAEKKRSESA